jgi:hypothetical protein
MGSMQAGSGVWALAGILTPQDLQDNFRLFCCDLPCSLASEQPKCLAFGPYRRPSPLVIAVQERQ